MTVASLPTVILTGGCGYIATHTLTFLLEHPYNVIILDNLSNSTIEGVNRVQQRIANEAAGRVLGVHEIDICDEALLRSILKKYKDDGVDLKACIHFAGLKAVGESVRESLMYYQNNIYCTIALVKVLGEVGCNSLVFSSSATVYGSQDKMPITEDSPTGGGITNAYGRTKHFIEHILTDHHASCVAKNQDPPSIVLLRYFNPVGSHPSGHIGEDPNGPPNNLMPYVSQTAVGRREFLTVFGDDYDTPDGTGVRDYIHVMDLAEGHMKAIDYASNKGKGKCEVFNLGTGKGYSVLEMVKAMEAACGKEIKYKIGPRREGDIATCYADPKKAREEMGWKASRGLEEMCADLWKWQSSNPTGYSSN